VSAGELAAMKDIERVLGYPLARISLPEYDYDGGSQPVGDEAEGRGQPRWWSHGLEADAADLSPEELAKLMRVG
jgi:hypothetical protein